MRISNIREKRENELNWDVVRHAFDPAQQPLPFNALIDRDDRYLDDIKDQLQQIEAKISNVTGPTFARIFNWRVPMTVPETLRALFDWCQWYLTNLEAKTPCFLHSELADMLKGITQIPMAIQETFQWNCPTNLTRAADCLLRMMAMFAVNRSFINGPSTFKQTFEALSDLIKSKAFVKMDETMIKDQIVKLVNALGDWMHNHFKSQALLIANQKIQDPSDLNFRYVAYKCTSDLTLSDWKRILEKFNDETKPKKSSRGGGLDQLLELLTSSRSHSKSDEDDSD